MARKMLVTGCSSGFGLAIARAAKERGWDVMGTVRKEADAAALLEAGCQFTVMDLCDQGSVETFGEAMRGWAEGGLHCLVNNAGTTYPGPTMGLTREDLRAQFEVNTIGHLAVSRELLAPLVAVKGRVMFISSISGFMPTPMLGAYAASKRALEAFAEAFALETAALGLSVCVIQPGPYETEIWATSVPRGERYLEATGPFPDDFVTHFTEMGNQVKAVALGQDMKPASDLGRFVVDKAEAKRVPFYLPSPGQPRLLRVLHRLLPTRWFHRIILSQLKKGHWHGSSPVV
jgi:NAD(P)-dependent dehydrogenase (short-subunit alcohol dehydrogenase family)